MRVSGGYLLVIFLVSALLGLSEGNATGTATYSDVGSSTISDSECSDDPACLRCSPVKGCLKCAVLITQPDRRCVNQCPSGARAQWSTRADYMGRVCVQRGANSNSAAGHAEPLLLGMSSEGLTVLTGVVAGSLLCILIISFAIVYVQYKKKALEQASETSSELDDSNHSGSQQRQYAGRRGEFLRQVDQLRPHAGAFLDMMNDTRRQLREAHRTGDGGATTAVFRPVICDLAKILILLNRRPDILVSEVQQHQMPPDDWEHLFNWAEKNLKRYKRVSDVSQPQVAQLINFLQAPSVVIDTDINQPREKDLTSNGTNIQVMSTFKPEQTIGSTLSLQDVAIKNFNANYGTAQTVLNPQWKFDYALVASTNLPISQFNPNIWKNGTNQYFLEDDFGQLGFRPQDEITTEL